MNYYNDSDAYCCQWLRNLIAARLIPDGVVDSRPIQEVRPEDVAGFTQCHFFAGLGGWSYALRLAGWPDDRPVWTGSCPCQPFSQAGKRKGAADDRHLWPDFYRIISGVRRIRPGVPPVILGEQVAAKAGYAWLDGVQADLEAEGFRTRAVDIPACGVGAPHIRNRIYWVAVAASEQRGLSVRQRGSLEAETYSGRGSEGVHGVAYSPSEPQREQEHKERSDARADAGGSVPGSETSWMGNSEISGERSLYRQCESYWGQQEQTRGSDDGVSPPDGLGLSRLPRLPLPEPEILPGEGWWEEGRAAAESGGAGSGSGGVDDSTGPRLGQAGSSQSPGFWDDFTIIGPDPKGKYRRVKPGICLLASGIPSRVAKLRSLGNSICPELAAEVIRAYMDTIDATAHSAVFTSDRDEL